MLSEIFRHNNLHSSLSQSCNLKYTKPRQIESMKTQTLKFYHATDNFSTFLELRNC